jgi:hypothetical protein
VSTGDCAGITEESTKRQTLRANPLLNYEPHVGQNSIITPVRGDLQIEPCRYR